MPRIMIATCAGVIAGLQLIHAQAVSPPARQLVAAQTATPARLPVRRVVLYKNGVGYFEHVGRVRGSQSVAIDFNTAQLNDVLKSLTTVDLGLLDPVTQSLRAQPQLDRDPCHHAVTLAGFLHGLLDHSDRSLSQLSWMLVSRSVLRRLLLRC